MSYPEFTVSSSIVNVDVATTSKVIFLPAAETVIGQSFLIRDPIGACGGPPGSNYIFISTVAGNLLNNTTDTISMTIPYQSVRVYAQNSSNYAVLQNDLQGRFWLQ